MSGWDNYLGKHCARLYGWLPPSLAFRKRKIGKIKYLTLCDTNAVDIFMFEKEGVLTRQANHTLTDVTICEMDDAKIADIFKNVNPPLRDSIVNGMIQKLILFEDTKELKAIGDDEDVKDIKKRRLLNLRRHALRLQESFPFDIINFDPCDSMLKPDSEMFKAFNKLFQLQDGQDEFLIFSTTPVAWNADILKLFAEDFKQNLKEYETIKNASKATLKTTEFSKITDVHKKAAIGFGKALIAKLAIKNGFISEQLGVYIYFSDKGSVMMSSVSLLKKANGGQIKDWYPQEIIKIINSMPIVYEPRNVAKDKKVKEHLDAVLARREQIQREF
jgi:hypothetical protein